MPRDNGAHSVSRYITYYWPSSSPDTGLENNDMHSQATKIYSIKHPSNPANVSDSTSEMVLICRLEHCSFRGSNFSITGTISAKDTSFYVAFYSFPDVHCNQFRPDIGLLTLSNKVSLAPIEPHCWISIVWKALSKAYTQFSFFGHLSN